jgi:hypothetical protein
MKGRKDSDFNADGFSRKCSETQCPLFQMSYEL